MLCKQVRAGSIPVASKGGISNMSEHISQIKDGVQTYQIGDTIIRRPYVKPSREAISWQKEQEEREVETS